MRDVRVLGANYIACDPKDQSELVIPVWDVGGGQSLSVDDGDSRVSGASPTPNPSQREGLRRCWGVFDVDSYDVGSFDVSDAEGAIAMLEVAGLGDRARLQGAVRVL